jgi:hypothetical protein
MTAMPSVTGGFGAVAMTEMGRDRPFRPDAFGRLSSGEEVSVPLSGKATGNRRYPHVLQIQQTACREPALHRDK